MGQQSVQMPGQLPGRSTLSSDSQLGARFRTGIGSWRFDSCKVKRRYLNSQRHRRVMSISSGVSHNGLVAKSIYTFFTQTPMVAAAATISLAKGATPYVAYASCAVSAWNEYPAQHLASPFTVQPVASPAKQPAKPPAVPPGFNLFAVFGCLFPGLSMTFTLTLPPSPVKSMVCGGAGSTALHVHVAKHSIAYQS